ncbi:unnamed protein product [Meganyctiphanes norvegica]|uniref:Condensation domain-containing protein n=1 Tax=Meganyctiphanes norvegica TaxID=48144 RepID=A0AAV2QZ71_MEGNR
MEVCRLCLHEHADKWWLCEVKNHNMDFEFIENKTALEVVEDMNDEGLNNSFWSARVVPVDGEENSIPDLKQAFPHQYNFLFKTHHGVMDGISLAYFMHVYTKILDDILSGKTVNDDVRFGNFRLDDPLQPKLKEIQQVLESDPLRLAEDKERILRVTTKQPILYSAYPKPKGIPSTTRHIVRKVDNAIVNTLYKCCKSKNVTVTAGFEAVFNTALVEMVTDAGAVDDVFKINTKHSINMRRYFKVDKDFKKFPLGCHLGGMQHETFCRKPARKHFWEHAQENHNNFQSLLKNNGPLIESIVRPQVRGPLDPDILRKGDPQDYSDYAFNNLLDLTPLVFYEGTQIQCKDVYVYNYLNNYLYPILFQFHTFRGFGSLTCSYDTAKVANDTAQELMDRVINVLEFVTK